MPVSRNSIRAEDRARYRKGMFMEGQPCRMDAPSDSPPVVREGPPSVWLSRALAADKRDPTDAARSGVERLRKIVEANFRRAK